MPVIIGNIRERSNWANDTTKDDITGRYRRASLGEGSPLARLGFEK
jgi:hypothetical protein